MTDGPAVPEPSLGPELWDVLARYVAGESPTAEAEVVRRWLAEDPRRGELLTALDRSIRSLAYVSPANVDVEAALRRVTARLNQPDVQSLPPRRAERLSQGWGGVGLRAAAAVALLLGVTLIWRATQSRSPVVAAQVYTTPVGRTDSVRFTDGSRAVLAPGTTLEVAAGYGGEIRSMELRGQALFDVVHDEKRPFVVRAGSALIEDLGTIFAIRSDDDDGVHVLVTSGSVLLQGPDAPKQGTSKPKPDTRKEERGVVLKAGERGTVGPDGRPVVERTAPKADDLAWTRGRLLFEDAPLSRVRSDLRRWYGVELQIADASLANRHLTASFAGEPIEDVLNVIALALGARIERRGDTVVVRAK